MAKEVLPVLGFACAIPIPDIHLIPDSMVVPLGIAKQNTIDTEGNRIPKLGLAHGQTFTKVPNSVSTNLLLDLNQSTKMI
jgi:hypothetical protein